MAYNDIKRYVTKNHPKRMLKRSLILKRVLAGALAGGLIAVGVYSMSRRRNSDDIKKTPIDSTESIVQTLTETNVVTNVDTEKEDIDTISKNDEALENGVYIDRWKGVNHYIAREEYVQYLAEESLNNIYKLLSEVKGITPMGTKTGEFYPEYYDSDFLTAIAFTESSYVIGKVDGGSLVSYTGATGICQIQSVAIDTLNMWLRDTMDLNITYSYEDANDPKKALEMCNLLNIRTCKNISKEGKSIYANMGVDYSPELQEKLILACYFYGEGNVKTAVANGSIMNTFLNANWKDKNGANYVFDVLNNKQAIILRNTQAINK